MTPEHNPPPSISTHDRQAERLRSTQQRSLKPQLCFTCGQPDHTAQSCPNSQSSHTRTSQSSTQHNTPADLSAPHPSSHPTQITPQPNSNQAQATPSISYPNSFPPLPPPFPTTYPSLTTSQPYSSTNTPGYDPSQPTLYHTQPQPTPSLILPHHILQPESIDEQISKLQQLRALQTQQQAERLPMCSHATVAFWFWNNPEQPISRLS